MTPGTDVAVSQGGEVAPLSYSPSDALEARDLALPRLYVAQAITNAVQDGNVKAGAIFVAQDSDDPAPAVLADKGNDKGVLFHVLALRKGKSISVDGDLKSFRFDDPNAPADAWVTYTYALLVPEYETDLPVRWLLTRTGRPAAQKINTALFKTAGVQPPYETAFRVTTTERQNDKGRYFIPRIHPAEADPANVEAAAALYPLIQESWASKSETPTVAETGPAI